MSTARENLNSLVRRLPELGFRKRAGELFTRPLTDEVIGWMGLNLATRSYGPGRISILPVIGVRHQEVERLVAEGFGRKPHQYLPPTISITLPELVPMPDRIGLDWLMVGDEQDQVVADDLCREVVGRAFPWMQQHGDLERICMELGPDHRPDISARYRWVVALWLLGRVDEAEAIAQRSIDELDNPASGWGSQLLGFMTWFLDRLHTGIPRNN